MPHKKVEINGVVIPSVTQVLGIIDKPFLKLWFGKLGTAECQRLLKEANATGTAVHEAIHQYLKGEMHDDFYYDYISSFREWKEFHNFKPIVLEPPEPLIDTNLGYQGTFDAVGRADEEMCICDWKTSSRISQEAPLQLAAYANLWNNGIHGTSLFVTTGWIVRIDKKTKKLDAKKFEHLDKIFPVFEACLKVWKFINE